MQWCHENISVAFVTCVVQQLRPRYRLLMLLEAACTVLFAWHVAAFELQSCGCASPRDHVLYHATVVSRCTRKSMNLPAAAIFRYVLWAKACTGRTDAKVQICLQTQTSCRLETSCMDDCVAGVTAAVAAHRRCKQRIKNMNQLALVLGVAPRGRCNRVREHIFCSLCNVRRTAVTSLVQIRCWRPLAQTVLFAWHVVAFALHSCGCASPKR